MQRVVGRKSILRRHRYFAGISVALVRIATLGMCASMLEQTPSRVWDEGLTVALDDLRELAELWMGCAAE
jgi:hypothetical protein